jgi:exonuclease III
MFGPFVPVVKRETTMFGPFVPVVKRETTRGFVNTVAQPDNNNTPQEEGMEEEINRSTVPTGTIPGGDTDKKQKMRNNPNLGTTNTSTGIMIATPSTTEVTKVTKESTLDDAIIKCVTLNCHGFKQSADYVTELIENNDVVCLCETWLRPNELDIIGTLISKKFSSQNSRYKVFAKSSMETVDPSYRGRPFGGVAIICQVKNDLLFHELVTDSDEIVAVAVCDKEGAMVQIITSVYMPYYQKGNHQQTEKYIECIDALQSFLDKNAPLAPIKLCGDFNVKLPVRRILNKHWYKEKGYNEHSKLLYDFLTGNELIAVDLDHNPADSFTYFSIENNTFTWIDHVISTEYDTHTFKYCKIQALDENNVSDHLPIKFGVKVNLHAQAARPPKSVNHPTPNWNDNATNNRYKLILETKLDNIPELTINKDTEPELIQEYIDTYLDQINQAILVAAMEAGVSRKQHFKTKSYWCPELNRVHAQKRFWWSLWVQNNRPRSGHIYDCWKNVKRIFRKLSRKFAQNVINLKYSKMNNFYNQSRMKCFWNSVKRSRTKKVSSTLRADGLANYFNEVMNTQTAYTQEQKDIEKFVQKQFYDNRNFHEQTNTFT